MSRIVLGVMGHVDHGKTALVHALTGMHTDRLAEEQARGISIALGFAHFRVGGHEADLIDMPGHERFVRTMVSGATGIDAMLLVVDAARGVMPQTREHVDVARLLGVRRALLAISRADLAEPGRAQHTAGQAIGLLVAVGLEVAATVACSARTGEGVAALREAIGQLASHAVPAPDDGAPWLPIDRSFSLAGHGTVVTGTLRGGTLTAGDTMEVAPGGLAVRLRTLQVHGAKVGMALPGQRVAVNLRGAEPGQVARGAALAAPGALAPAAWLSVRLHAVADAPKLPTGARLRLLFGTAEVDARVRLLGCDVLEPGCSTLAQLHCEPPVCVPARARFVLRAASPPRTLAGGAVLDPQTSRARRHAPPVLAHLAALDGAAPAELVATELAQAGSAGASLSRLARLSGLGAPRVAAALAVQEAMVTRSGEAASRQAFAHLQDALGRAVAAAPAGVARTALAGLLPGAGPGLVDAAADRLLAAGSLVRDGAILRVPSPEHDARRARALQTRAAELTERLRTAGLSPPDIGALAPDLPARRLLDGLVRAGLVIRAPDRVQKREILFHRDAIDAARRALAPLLADRPLLVSEIGAALGISRKYSVPLLEHLDSVQFTRRVAERRVLAGR